MNTSVILFGSVPLATWVLKRLIDHKGFNIVGVVCEPSDTTYDHHGLPEPSVFKFASERGVQVLGLESAYDEAVNLEKAMGISVRFHKILSGRIINAFNLGIINLHGGELPRFRGVNCANHAILEGVTRGAGTLHFIDEGVDTGAIIDREYFDIDITDTAFEVFTKTTEALKVAFSRQLESMAEGSVQCTPQSELIARGEQAETYRKSDLDRYRSVPFQSDPSEVDRRARAYAFPGHEPAYFDVGGQRIYLVPQLMWKGRAERGE